MAMLDLVALGILPRAIHALSHSERAMFYMINIGLNE